MRSTKTKTLLSTVLAATAIFASGCDHNDKSPAASVEWLRHSLQTNNYTQYRALLTEDGSYSIGDENTFHSMQNLLLQRRLAESRVLQQSDEAIAGEDGTTSGDRGHVFTYRVLMREQNREVLAITTKCFQAPGRAYQRTDRGLEPVFTHCRVERIDWI